MILVYCVVGVIVVIVTVIAVWYICANRHEWCVKVTKKEVVKKRVRREALTEVFQPPAPLGKNVDLGKIAASNDILSNLACFTSQHLVILTIRLARLAWNLAKSSWYHVIGHLPIG